MAQSALIVGGSGIVGSAAADLLASSGWEVFSLARNPVEQAGVTPVAADLADLDGLKSAVAGLAPTLVVMATWTRRETEAEMIEVNGRLARNVLTAVRDAGSVGRVALVTGLKHYLGPFEAYGKGKVPETPFREEQGRLDVDNFYYAQEDAVFEAAERDGFSWSVHRPHTMIGKAVGNAMNMGTTLAVYASICKATGRPFRFPGSPAQWGGLTDMTDARLLARHILWASTTDAARNQDFNVVNGDVFRWSWMWRRIADWFELSAAGFDGEIADRHGLRERDLSRLVSPWHTDADLGRPIEVVTDMGKSRRLGFLDYQPTDDAFFALFERLRADRLIP